VTARPSIGGRLPAVLCLWGLVLAGCVDQFTSRPAPPARAYAGESTGLADPTRPRCGPFRFDVAVRGDRIGGDAFPVGWSPERATFGMLGVLPAAVTDDTSHWYVAGTVAADDTVELEVRMQAPYWYGARPYTIFRGAYAGEAIVLREPSRFCGREITLSPG
jgi:hypothetical protein